MSDEGPGSGQQPAAQPYPQTPYGQTPYGQQPGYVQPAFPTPAPGYPAPGYHAQGFGPTGYGAPQYGAPRPRRNRTPLFVALGVVAAAAAVVLVLAFTGVFGGDGSSSDGNSPADAVRGYLTAAEHEDPKAAEPYTCQANQPSLKSAEAEPSSSADSDGHIESFTIVSTTPSGSALDKATSATVQVIVKVAVTGSGASTLPSQPVPLVKESGAWKVCVTD